MNQVGFKGEVLTHVLFLKPQQGCYSVVDLVLTALDALITAINVV